LEKQLTDAKAARIEAEYRAAKLEPKIEEAQREVTAAAKEREGIVARLKAAESKAANLAGSTRTYDVRT
jgi:hypothetical protein